MTNEEAKEILKAEAVREFAERLKNKIKIECNPSVRLLSSQPKIMEVNTFANCVQISSPNQCLVK